MVVVQFIADLLRILSIFLRNIVVQLNRTGLENGFEKT